MTKRETIQNLSDEDRAAMATWYGAEWASMAWLGDAEAVEFELSKIVSAENCAEWGDALKALTKIWKGL
jgi:hypothetical protein